MSVKKNWLATAAAIATILGAVFSAYEILKSRPHSVEQAGGGNTQGDVTASQGGIAIGHGNTVNIANGPAEKTRLFLKCDMRSLPQEMPPSGSIFVLRPAVMTPEQLINSDVAAGASILEQFGPIKSPIIWFADDNFIAGYKCEFFNYGSGPIFKVDMNFILTAREGVSQLGPSNRTILATQGNIKIPKVDAGKDTPFVFYLFNPWPCILEYTQPQQASFENPRGDIEKAAITLPEQAPVALFPHQVKKQ